MADLVEQRLVQRVREPKRGKGRKPGPPVHDDLCAVIDERRSFDARRVRGHHEQAGHAGGVTTTYLPLVQ